MTSTKRILEFVGKTRMTGMVAGSARSLLTRAFDDPVSGAAVRRFAEDVYAIPRSDKGPTVIHPLDSNIARSYRRGYGDGRESAELTQAELVWLQRLPLDPEAITHDDAARLGGMAGSVSQMKSPSSYQLVQSIWAPVKEVHDRKVAKHKLDQAREALPSVPSSARAALEATLRTEHRDWPDSAIQAHAGELLGEAIARRDGEHEQRVRRAQAVVDELEASASDRVAMSREKV